MMIHRPGSVLCCQAAEFVNGALRIALTKAATLQFLSMKGASLPSAEAVRLISSVPGIALDLGDGGLGQETQQLYVNPAAKVLDLNLSGSPYYSMMWWGAFPASIVKLDISGPKPPVGFSLFSALAKAFRTLQGPIALRSVSVAEVSAHVSVPEFCNFLSGLLNNVHIRATSLDITGCRSGDQGLACLGSCLRTNRTLTTLKMDGQAAALIGWTALRGCLYGNQKLAQLSYPFYDCSAYFDFIAKQVSTGWTEALHIKAQIGAAHRSANWARKRQCIEAIKVCKRKFKALERDRFKSIAVLQAIFTAVEQNAALSSALSASKMQGQLGKPFMVQAQDRIVDKQGAFLSKLQAQLNELRFGGQVGTAFAQVVEVPAMYAKYTGAQPSAPPPPAAALPSGQVVPVAYPVSSHAPSHTVSHTWDDIEMMLSSGPMLFVPQTFYQFCALVELVGGRSSPKVSKTLCEIEAFIRSTQQKTAQWGTAPHAFASTLAASRPAAFGAFNNFKFVNQQRPQQQRQPQRQPQRPAPRAFNASRGNRHQDHAYYGGTYNNHHDTTTNATNANNNIGNATNNDPVDTHTSITDPNNPSDADDTGTGIDGDTGDGPGDADDAVDMYGGCGPR